MIADPSAPGGTGLLGDPKFADQEPVLESVFRALDLPDPFTVLDLGCGYGRMYDLLHEALPGRRFSYDGVDVEPRRVSAFRDRLMYAPDAWVGLFPHSAERFLDWAKDGRWDLVLAVELLMHLPPDEAESLARRALGRGTYLVTCDWDRPSERETAPGNYLHDYDTFWNHQSLYPAGPYQTVRLVTREE